MGAARSDGFSQFYNVIGSHIRAGCSATSECRRRGPKFPAD
jgi:hypothetical protein